MTYKATDGTVFSDRDEYRKYEMETQYTFRNRTSEKLVKLPGSVQGQPFDIVNCKDCEILILDHCDQIQLDDLAGCKLFIGACSGSIFLRGCRDCQLTIACKQFRTRDCENCMMYLYCKTEPIIETSWDMKFAAFNGAYPEHEAHMRKAELDPKHNLWKKVFDFNDSEKTGKNWSLVDLPPDETQDDMLWCPMGEAKNCCELRIDNEKQTSSLLSSFTTTTSNSSSFVDAALNLTSHILPSKFQEITTCTTQNRFHNAVVDEDNNDDDESKCDQDANSNFNEEPSIWASYYEYFLVNNIISTSSNVIHNIFGWFPFVGNTESASTLATTEIVPVQNTTSSPTGKKTLSPVT